MDAQEIAEALNRLDDAQKKSAAAWAKLAERHNALDGDSRSNTAAANLEGYLDNLNTTVNSLRRESDAQQKAILVIGTALMKHLS